MGCVTRSGEQGIADTVVAKVRLPRTKLCPLTILQSTLTSRLERPGRHCREQDWTFRNVRWETTFETIEQFLQALGGSMKDYGQALRACGAETMTDVRTIAGLSAAGFYRFLRVDVGMTEYDADMMRYGLSECLVASCI